ncbi:hypothetical protein [Nostoc sp. LPT]|nr:hypothetical protein [Nostoc sp. LPT]MBN4005307.1 hypothetical protein [Nostoc sp. LPT]
MMPNFAIASPDSIGGCLKAIAITNSLIFIYTHLFIALYFLKIKSIFTSY